jgi:hypothetical protein
MMPQTWGDLAHQGTWVSIYRQPRAAGRKTDRFVVVTREGGVVLGEIRWYAPWHTYVFRPRPETIWEAVCLSEVGQALAVLTTAYKRKGVV